MQLGRLQHHRHRPERSDCSDRKKTSINLNFEHGFPLWMETGLFHLPSRDTKEIEAPSFREGRKKTVGWKVGANFEEPLETADQAAVSFLSASF
jgi:hypothetical protein